MKGYERKTHEEADITGDNYGGTIAEELARQWCSANEVQQRDCALERDEVRQQTRASGLQRAFTEAISRGHLRPKAPTVVHSFVRKAPGEDEARFHLSVSEWAEGSPRLEGESNSALEGQGEDLPGEVPGLGAYHFLVMSGIAGFCLAFWAGVIGVIWCWD